MSNDNKALADVQPGGMVRLGDRLPPIREDEPLRGDEPAAEQHDARMFNRGWNACREAVAALSARPFPGGQCEAITAASEAIDDLHEEMTGTRIGDEVSRQFAEAALNAALAASQPVGDA